MPQTLEQRRVSYPFIKDRQNARRREKWSSMSFEERQKARSYAQASYRRNIDYNRRYHKAYNLAHPGLKRRQHLRNLYNLTIEQYESMLKEQDGVCAICKKKETYIRQGVIVPLHVDHDHRTGRVRALLCCKCNAALGNCEESIDRMNAIMDYLIKYKDPILL